MKCIVREHAHTSRETIGGRIGIVHGFSPRWGGDYDVYPQTSAAVVRLSSPRCHVCPRLRQPPGRARNDYIQRGAAWYDKNQYDKAIADLNRGHPARSQGRQATSTAAMPGWKEGLRQGHRRLHRGHPARSQGSHSAYIDRGDAWRARESYDKAIADYTEAIRLDPKDGLGLRQPRRRLARQEGVRQGHRRLHRGHPARSQDCAAPTTAGAMPGMHKKDYDKAIADYTEAIRLDPQDARGLLQPGQRLVRARRSTTRRSPTSPRPSGSIPRMPMAFSNRG